MRILVCGGTRAVARLATRHADRLGHLATPRDRNRTEALARTGLPLAADNGCWSGFDPAAFRRMLRRLRAHPSPLWVACPDVVGDARATRALWPEWEAEVRGHGLTPCYVLQDGQESLDLPEARAYFVGGTTAWKLGPAAADLVAEARARGAWVHMGRCSTLRRLGWALRLGCDSVDGTAFSRFPCRLEWALRRLGAMERQGWLF